MSVSARERSAAATSASTAMKLLPLPPPLTNTMPERGRSTLNPIKIVRYVMEQRRGGTTGPWSKTLVISPAIEETWFAPLLRSWRAFYGREPCRSFLLPVRDRRPMYHVTKQAARDLLIFLPFRSVSTWHSAVADLWFRKVNLLLSQNTPPPTTHLMLRPPPPPPPTLLSRRHRRCSPAPSSATSPTRKSCDFDAESPSSTTTSLWVNENRGRTRKQRVRERGWWIFTLLLRVC